MKLLLYILPFMAYYATAQQNLNINDPDLFINKNKNWFSAKDVNVDIEKNNEMTFSPGESILANIHNDGKYGSDYDLFTKFQHGDIDISFDFMMAKGSNSGLYFQSKYEVQLLDSWNKKNPKYDDCGGIYERWDESKPEGQKGYEGIAPRGNACKYPGTWQHIDISFEAAKFDASGKKISNAKFIYIKLNGQILHENAEVSGPTRGAASENENMKGPLQFQGDHGSLAIRNVVYNIFDKNPATVSKVNYKTFYGSYLHDFDLNSIKAVERGENAEITHEHLKKSNDYVIVFKGNYNAPETGDYTFNLHAGGHAFLKIDQKEVIKNAWDMPNTAREGKINLTTGEHVFEIMINKRDGWIPSALGFFSAGPGFRMTPHHILSSFISSKPSDPILINAEKYIVLRSFMDFKKDETAKNHRITHAVSVGCPDQIHYTYDMDNAAIVQIWKGGFLDASPMWNDRGDGSSRPLGMLLKLNYKPILVESLNNLNLKDTIGTNYKPLGYTLDNEDIPTFKYKMYGAVISDKSKIDENKHFNRTISITDKSKVIYAKLAEAKSIEKISEKLYSIDDKSYFIKLNEGSGAEIIDSKTLVVKPVNGVINYSILF